MNAALPTVAALYVDPNGVYAGLPSVEVWDEARDARTYAGPWPVVAHPPCARWCQLAPLVAQKLAYLGEKYAIGNDGGCFEAALRAIRTYGGVLEHPAYSLAWYRYGLPVPGHGGWTTTFDDPGFASAVSQVAYGHQARKRTWLYAIGCDLPELRWNEPPAEAQVSALWPKRAKGIMLDKGKSNPTPEAFRDVLIAMARSARVTNEKLAYLSGSAAGAVDE
jgi:hypothetical protein